MATGFSTEQSHVRLNFKGEKSKMSDRKTHRDIVHQNLENCTFDTSVVAEKIVDILEKIGASSLSLQKKSRYTFILCNIDGIRGDISISFNNDCGLTGDCKYIIDLRQSCLGYVFIPEFIQLGLTLDESLHCTVSAEIVEIFLNKLNFSEEKQLCCSTINLEQRLDEVEKSLKANDKLLFFLSGKEDNPIEGLMHCALVGNDKSITHKQGDVYSTKDSLNDIFKIYLKIARKTEEKQELTLKVYRRTEPMPLYDPFHFIKRGIED